MIVVLNGSVGVGKTSVAWALNECFDTSVMLDGDYLGAVHPFRLHDAARVTYLYQMLAHLVSFHQKHGYTNFVVNYVFESPESLSELVRYLRPLEGDIYTFWLVCSEDEQRRRILRRKTDQWASELERFAELNAILEVAAARGDIGTRVDTTDKSVAEIVQIVRKVAM